MTFETVNYCQKVLETSGQGIKGSTILQWRKQTFHQVEQSFAMLAWQYDEILLLFGKRHTLEKNANMAACFAPVKTSNLDIKSRVLKPFVWAKPWICSKTFLASLVGISTLLTSVKSSTHTLALSSLISTHQKFKPQSGLQSNFIISSSFYSVLAISERSADS